MSKRQEIEAAQRQLAAATEAAHARIVTQSSEALRQVRKNAARKEVEALVAACDAELALRGPYDYTSDEAVEAARIAPTQQGKSLSDRIAEAFRDIPASDHELELLRLLAAQPGRSYAAIHKAYSRRDTAQVPGNMIRDRFGYFRNMPEAECGYETLMIVISQVDRKKTWGLRDEAKEALAGLDVI